MQGGRFQRIRDALAGSDAPGKRPLPASELLHPAPIVVAAMLVVNDRLLKGSPAPAWITGKLSDFAGLFVFPLVLTAVLDTTLWLLTRRRGTVDYTLRRYKLVLACLATAGAFTAIKLSAPLANAVAGALPGTAQIVADPSDLLALPSILVAYWHGMREIARVPRGRVERYLTTQDADEWLDVDAAGPIVAGLDRYLETQDASAAETAMRAHRELR